MTAKNTERNERIRSLASEGKSFKQIAAATGLTEGIVAGVLKDRDKDNERKRQQRAELRAAKAGGEPVASESAAIPVSPATEADDRFPVHPAAELFPLLSDGELRELAEDIQRRHGLTDPIVIYQGQILDGRNRLAACDLAGVRPTYHSVNDEDLGDGGALGYVLSKNLHRRHLTGEQKRAVAAQLLKLDPSQSNRRIAEKIGVDHKTVANVREEQEASGEIPQLAETTGKDGRVRRKKERTESPPREPVENIPDAAASEDQRQGDLFAGGSRATPTPYPTVPPNPPATPERQTHGVGVIRAQEAINCLKRIPPHDPLRKRGFQIVADWVKKNA